MKQFLKWIVERISIKKKNSIARNQNLNVLKWVTSFYFLLKITQLNAVQWETSKDKFDKENKKPSVSVWNPDIQNPDLSKNRTQFCPAQGSKIGMHNCITQPRSTILEHFIYKKLYLKWSSLVRVRISDNWDQTGLGLVVQNPDFRHPLYGKNNQAHNPFWGFSLPSFWESIAFSCQPRRIFFRQIVGFFQSLGVPEKTNYSIKCVPL